MAETGLTGQLAARARPLLGSVTHLACRCGALYSLPFPLGALLGGG